MNSAGRQTFTQPALVMQRGTQSVRPRSETVHKNTEAAVPTPLDLFNRNVREQHAVRLAILLLEGRVARLSERLDVASVALQRSSSAQATSQRGRTNKDAIQVQLTEARTQIRAKRLQLQKLVTQLDLLVPSLPAYARVPLEIYTVIVETVYAEFIAEQDFLSASRFPWLLCAVCSWWRSMTPTLPQLWSTIHFPIRASPRYDQNLDFQIGRQLSFASPHSRTLTLWLSIQQGAHVCNQRPHAEKYRACLQRVLDRTDTIIFADCRRSESSCDNCLSVFASESTEFSVAHPLVSSAVFIRVQDTNHARIQTWQYLPPTACAQLRKMKFNNHFPNVHPDDSFPLVEEIEIVTPSAECDFFFIQDVFDTCPSLHTLNLNCGHLLSFRSWGASSTSSSTLQSLTLKTANLDDSIMDNYPIRLLDLRTLTLVFPDMAYSPTTIHDLDMQYTRTSLVGNIIQHAPRLSKLSVAGLPMAAVVRTLPTSISPLQLKALHLGGTYVEAGLGEELAKTAKLPPCVTFFGLVAVERGDLWNECLISLGDDTRRGLEETGTALLQFTSPVEMQVDPFT